MQVTQPRCRCRIPILYYDELGPQSRSCYMLINVLDIDVELQPINTYNGQHLNDPHRKINPSTIPTLVDGKYIISDGHSIMIYLCDKYACVNLHHLCPCDYLPRLNVLNMLFNQGCALHRRYSHLVTELFMKKYPNVNMGYHQAKVLDSYNCLENNLKGQLCLAGNCLTIADLSIITTLSGLDLIFPISPYKWPNLHRWFENLKNMDCYKCNEGGIQILSHLLETEGQYPVLSRPTLEATPAQRSSSTDKKLLNSSKVKENAQLPRNERRYLSEKEIAKANDRKPTANETLRKSESKCKGVTTSAASESQTEEFSNFFPKIRTSKIIINPSHSTYHEAKSSSQREKIYEKPAAKGLQNTEVTCGVEDCQPERNIHYKANRSKINLNQRYHHMNDCNHKENSNLKMTELPRNERRYLGEKEIAKDNDRKPTESELRKSESTCKGVTPSAASESLTEEFSNFFPKIRTSKIIINPSHSTYHEAESSSQREKMYEKPVAKELQNSEVACGVEDCRPERNIHYKAKRSKMDLNQRYHHMNVCNHKEKSNLKMTGPIHCCDSMQPTLKYINADQCPCCSDYRKKEICSNDKDELRDYRSYICNCDPSCLCAARMTETRREECGCKCQDDISDEDCESYEEDNCECDDDAMVFLIS